MEGGRLSGLVEQLYRDHGAEIAAAALLCTDDPYGAEALTHETFLRVGADKNLPVEPDPRPELYRAMYRAMRGRRVGPRPRHTVAEEHPIIRPQGFVAAEPLLDGLQGLPQAARDATVLRELAGLDVALVAGMQRREVPAVEADLRLGRQALSATPGAPQAYQALMENTRAPHEERTEDLSYSDLGGRSLTTYLAGACAVLMLLGWVAARLLGGSGAPARVARPAAPPAATRAFLLDARPTARPGVIASSRGVSAPDFEAPAIVLPTVEPEPPRGKSAGYVWHIKAEHEWRTPKGRRRATESTELWLDPGNGDARYVETKAGEPSRVVHVRRGNEYTVIVPEENSTTTRTLPDASDPLRGAPQEYVFAYKAMLDSGRLEGQPEVVVDGRRAYVFVTGNLWGGQRARRVWVDKANGMLLREFTYYVNVGGKLVEADRHYIRYTLRQKAPRDKLEPDTFEPVVTPGPRATQAEVGSDPWSPLAIPPAQLERLGLLEARDWRQDDRMGELLENHGGRRLFGNLWDGPDKDGPGTTIFGVLDERYAFSTERSARAFLTNGVLDAGDGPPMDGDRRARTVTVAGRTVLLKRGSLDWGRANRLYVFAFRVGSIVARVGVVGDDGLTEKQATRLVRVAIMQTERGLQQPGEPVPDPSAEAGLP